MKDDLRWGYEIPYMITGILNKHPKASLDYMKASANGTQQLSFSDFFNTFADSEDLD